MEIRPIKKNQVAQASKIVGKNYSKLFERKSRREINAAFTNKVNGPKYLVAEEKGKVVGFAGYIESWMDYDFYQIFWVNVEPEFQGKHIGTVLVEKVISEIRKRNNVRFILLTTTKPSFYRKFGFRSLLKFKKDHELMILDLRLPKKRII